MYWRMSYFNAFLSSIHSLISSVIFFLITEETAQIYCFQTIIFYQSGGFECHCFWKSRIQRYKKSPEERGKTIDGWWMKRNIMGGGLLEGRDVKWNADYLLIVLLFILANLNQYCYLYSFVLLFKEKNKCRICGGGCGVVWLGCFFTFSS